ncbi:MAG: cobalt-precorrin-5B (C(1))-methyltransferase CbiD [Lachnospiraceae bacterium]|nr:cobalt-precorrin-5B (C(1))-methyltransferase CbiD [Lachnospiraceae bacterium]
MELREGYTTGTCAALASKAAARMIFEGRKIEKDSILTPSGKIIEAEILDAEYSREKAKCAVKKDAGDDPDVTDGMLIFSGVTLHERSSIDIDGGEGVGRITRPGLGRKPGEAAINKVPREMIEEAVRSVFEEMGYEGGADIVITVPGGEEIAKKTFNPRLGIEGGISILGSSGIVKPMSEDAIIETVKAEIDIRSAEGEEKIVLTPGNYGRDFIKDHYGYDLERSVICSNYIGAAIDHAAAKGFKEILLIGHAGKLVKLAGGIMNTHSRNADCRMEIIAASAAYFTEDTGFIKEILSSGTTDEAFDKLKKAGILTPVMQRIGERAGYYIRERLKEYEGLITGLIIFSNERGVLYEDKPYRSGTR